MHILSVHKVYCGYCILTLLETAIFITRPPYGDHKFYHYPWLYYYYSNHALISCFFVP